MEKNKKIAKNDYLDLLKENCKLEGENTFLTKKQVEAFFEKLDAVIETTSKELGDKEEVKLGKYIVIEKKHVEAKSGDINGKPYTSEAKDVTKLKSSGQVKGL